MNSLMLSLLLMTTPILSDLPNENIVEEQIPVEEEDVENNEEKGYFEELIAKWLNGEIEISEETLKEIQVYLEPEVDKMLQEYIADNEERQMVTSVIMGIISGLAMLVIMFLYTKKIVNANKEANNNNSKFAITSSQIKESSEIIKNEVSTLKESLLHLSDVINSEINQNEKTQLIVDETLGILENKLNGLAGILKIVYEPEKEVAENEETSK